jgi:hypothetical protein
VPDEDPAMRAAKTRAIAAWNHYVDLYLAGKVLTCYQVVDGSTPPPTPIPGGPVPLSHG